MIAIIPARGGSKGLPGKNIKVLNGKPLIAYTIEAALASEYIKHVIVSTDDEQIAAVASEYGASVPFLRPDSLATDGASTKDVIIYTIKRLADDYNIQAEEFVILQPTSPLRTAAHIDDAYQQYKESDALAIVSYCEESHPIAWNRYIGENGRLMKIFDLQEGHQRQQERKSYYPNGAIYIYDTEAYLNGSILENDTIPFLMNKNVSIDIDTLEDFEMCQYLMHKHNL